jgi:flagellar FliL protein
MSDTIAESGTQAGPAGRRRGLIAGLAAAALLGAAGFVAARFRPWEGILAPGTAADDPARGIAFVPVPAFVVSLGDSGSDRHLRFGATLEVAAASAEAVTHLMPRILDVLNGYLRAVDPAELAAPSALMRLRAQMLRRIRIVAGEDAVRDLLISEFVLD